MSPLTENGRKEQEKTQNEIQIECKSLNQLCTIHSKILNEIVKMMMGKCVYALCITFFITIGCTAKGAHFVRCAYKPTKRCQNEDKYKVCIAHAMRVCTLLVRTGVCSQMHETIASNLSTYVRTTKKKLSNNNNSLQRTEREKMPSCANGDIAILVIPIGIW